MVSTTRPYELLYLDLCGPMRVRSIRGKSYILVIVDDFSRFTWDQILNENEEALKIFSKHCEEMQMLLNLPIVSVRSDHRMNSIN